MVSVVSVPEASNPVSERSIDSFARNKLPWSMAPAPRLIVTTFAALRMETNGETVRQDWI